MANKTYPKWLSKRLIKILEANYSPSILEWQLEVHMSFQLETIRMNYQDQTGQVLQFGF